MSAPGSDRLQELRAAFDRGFTESPSPPARDTEPLLLIACGGERFAVPMVQVAELVVGRAIVPLPSGHPELIGLAGIRGNLVSVFDLALLLKAARHQAFPRWLAVTRQTSIGLAFDDLEGFADIDPASLHCDDAAPARQFVRRWVRTGPVIRGVIEIPAVIEAVRAGRTDDKEGADKQQ